MSHRLDPRTKIVSVLFLSFVVVRGDWFTLLMVGALLLALTIASRFSPIAIFAAFKPVVYLFAFLFLLHLFLTEGVPIPPFPLGPVSASFEGLKKGLLLVSQFGLLIWAAFILTSSTLPMDLICGMERLLRPLRKIGIPSHDVAIMISLALRFVPTLVKEMTQVKEAQMARGADFARGSPARRIRRIATLVLPVTTNLIRNVDALAEAMEARGYKRGGRTYLKELRLSAWDYKAGIALLLLGACSILVGLLTSW
jgi:biotin transport system permease protein/energy-coupling factor transport system permease protein